MITIEGRKGLKITFFENNPEQYLEDVSLVGSSISLIIASVISSGISIVSASFLKVSASGA